MIIADDTLFQTHNKPVISLAVCIATIQWNSLFRIQLECDLVAELTAQAHIEPVISLAESFASIQWISSFHIPSESAFKDAFGAIISVRFGWEVIELCFAEVNRSHQDEFSNRKTELISKLIIRNYAEFTRLSICVNFHVSFLRKEPTRTWFWHGVYSASREPCFREWRQRLWKVSLSSN